MQLMINTLEETRATLLLASRFLAEHAALLPASEPDADEAPAEHKGAPSINGPGHKIELTDGTKIDLGSGATVSHESIGDASVTHVSVPPGTSAPTAPPAPSNVLPFVVPPAPSPNPSVATNAATPPVSGTPASAPAAGNGATTPTTGAGATAVEYDSAGLAWDERIHQTTRKKKSDGTWMLKRRVDAALVEQVTKELLARKGVPSVADGAPLANIPAPPSGLFVPPPPPAEPAKDPNAVFGPPTGDAPGAAAAVTLPPTGLPVQPPATVASVPPPPASASVPNVPNGAGMAAPAAPNPLRDFVMKCSRLTSGGMITKEQQDAALQQAGVPSMAALAQMQHLIPNADYFVSKAAGLVA